MPSSGPWDDDERRRPTQHGRAAHAEAIVPLIEVVREIARAQQEARLPPDTTRYSDARFPDGRRESPPRL